MCVCVYSGHYWYTEQDPLCAFCSKHSSTHRACRAIHYAVQGHCFLRVIKNGNKTKNSKQRLAKCFPQAIHTGRTLTPPECLMNDLAEKDQRVPGENGLYLVHANLQ